jgi:hypothetical protein
VRFHKPQLTAGQVASARHQHAAADAALTAEGAARATEDRLADWVMAQLRDGRTLADLEEQWGTRIAGIDLAALVDRRLDLKT